MAYTTKHSLEEAVLSHDISKIEQALQFTDVNYTTENGIPLYFAITGTKYNLNRRGRKGKFKTVEYLLKRGANPNKKIMTTSMISACVIEGRADMVVLLLSYGANPNSYYFKIENTITKRKICTLPLIDAILNLNVHSVEALIYYGALYNKKIIVNVKTAKERFKRKSKEGVDDMNEYKKYKKILEILEKHYNESIEKRTSDFLTDNTIKGDIVSFFKGLQE